MRNCFADTFYHLAKSDHNLAIVVADISPAGSIAQFRKEFPDRFINTGVAEQIMIGMAAGMALRGMRVFAYTIATFALYRPFEFIRDDLAYQGLPVTVVGIGGGITYSTLGATHHTMEDIAIASAIPNMKVIAPCDPLETQLATEWCALENTGGPVYLRLGKAGEPNITDHAEAFEYGKIRKIIQGHSDVCIIGYGPILGSAIRDMRKFLYPKNIEPSVYSCHTLKPLDCDGIKKLFRSYSKIYVIEEHVYFGGLASQIKNLAYEDQYQGSIKNVALKDEFIHLYGQHDALKAAHQLSIDFN